MKLYHVGFSIIEHPDLLHGRKNADFGQGFYLSSDLDFSKRWAKTRKGLTSYINVYELDETDLNIKRFNRDHEWFSYLFNNRHNQDDAFKDYDVIVGPIANDTIYDTWGIITSGYIKDEIALDLFCSGPCYLQVAIKTPFGNEHLHFLKAEEICHDDILSYRESVRKEEIQYQELIANKIGDILKELS